MSKKISVLFVGESWFTEIRESKGFDFFSTGRYEEAIEWIQGAVESGGMDFCHIPCHRVEFDFPKTIEEMKKYDVIMLSDVGANTFLLGTETFVRGKKVNNKLALIKEFVAQGGGFCMIGGYLTFQGFEAKGNYKGTPVEEVLPVDLHAFDDRHEMPEGFTMELTDPSHDVLKGISGPIPFMLGYNRLVPKADAKILAKYENDPIIAVMEYGKGRSMAYASDCSPHWSSMEFCTWEHYPKLWQNIVHWLANA